MAEHEQHFESRKNRKKKKSKALFVILPILIILIVAIAGTLYFKPFAKKAAAHKTVAQQVSKKKTLVSTSAKPVAAPWLNSAQENQLPIMMYHNVGDNPTDNNTITPANFEDDLKTLQAQGYTTVNSNDAIRILTTKQKPSNKMVWLTFDDGLESFYQSVFPLLKKYHTHATSFIITNNTKNSVAGTMTPAQLKEIQASGLVDFQSHTMDHVELGSVSDADQKTQLAGSKAYLDQLLHQNTQVICYPSGSHGPDTPQIAQSLGYKLGLLDPGRTYDGLIAENEPAAASQGLFFLNRFRTSTEMNGQALLAMIQPATDYNTQNTVK